MAPSAAVRNRKTVNSNCSEPTTSLAGRVDDHERDCSCFGTLSHILGALPGPRWPRRPKRAGSSRKRTQLCSMLPLGTDAGIRLEELEGLAACFRIPRSGNMTLCGRAGDWIRWDERASVTGTETWEPNGEEQSRMPGTTGDGRRAEEGFENRQCRQ